MNKLINVQSVFAVFGNFSSLIKNINDVKPEFAGFETREQKEQLPNGLQVPFYVIHKENMAIIIRSARLDVQYGYKGETDSFENFLSFVDDTCKKLNAHLTNKLNRVSYTNVAFVDKTEENFKKFADIFNANNIFGQDAKELQVRLNNIVDIDGEKINAVLLTQDGHVTKKAEPGQAPEPVIFLNNDINTLAERVEARFTLMDAQKLLSDLLMLANERTNKILSNI